MVNQKLAYIYGLTTVFLWSTVASACKLTLAHFTPAEMVLYASIVSIIFFTTVVFYTGKQQKLYEASRRDWAKSLGFALLNPICYYLIVFKSYDLLPAQQAQPLNYTWAITLSILSVPLLGQRLSRKQIISILISYFGVLVICTKGNLVDIQFDSGFGVFLALFSTVFWSLYWIANTSDKRDPMVGLLMNFILALPCIVLYIWLFEGFRVPSFEGLLGSAYLGLFEMGLAYLLWLKALKYATSAARIANLIFLSPFLSLVFIYFIVGEQIHPASVVGLILIIVGLILQTKSKRE